MKKTGRNKWWLFLAAVLLIAGCGGGGGGGGTASYTVGGTVSGLTGTVVLQNNAADDLTVTANGAFTFETALADGAAFSVTVLTQPSGQTCSVANGFGTIAGANVTNVAVTCSINTFTVGGTVSGLSGTVVLQNNGTDDLSLTTNGPFTFTAPIADGSPYSVTVKTQPVAQTCFVTTGDGAIAGANVTNVAVNCFNSGSLSTSFGSAGIVVHNNAAGGNGSDSGYAIALDSSGRILVAGASGNVAGNNDMVIWRFKPDGTLDTAFDTDGIAVHNNAAGGNGSDGGSAIALDSSGRILVTGDSRNAAGNNDMVIWRFNPNGTLDTTFDTDGIVVHNNAAGGNGYDSGSAIALDSSGRILVAGVSTNAAGNNDMVIWRFKPDGTLDTTFDTDGIVVHNNAAGGNSSDGGSAIALDSSGRILVAGGSYNAAVNSDMVIWRFKPDGTLDTTFDSDGIVVHNNASGGNSSDGGSAIALDSSGRILVAGLSRNVAGNNDMVIWRFKPDGTLDTAFDTDGIAVHNNAAGGNGSDSGVAIALDSSGRILVEGGSRNVAGNNDMVIWRFKPDGTLDTTFDTDGIAVHNNAAGGNGFDEGVAIALDSSGRILVAGQSNNAAGDTDMVIWRFNP